MLIPVTLFVLYVNVCEKLMLKNRGGEDAEGFCYGRTFQIELDSTKNSTENGTDLFEHASHLQEQLAVGLSQPRK